ncbi:LPP20 family lipoprotein [Thermodesulfobacteriota bacterium]
MLMNRPRFWLAFFLAMSALCLSTCATKVELPPYLTNPGAHPKYPRSKYITAVGMSTESARAAELDATSRVAEQIQSDIEAETTSTIGEKNMESIVDIYSEVQTKTSFRHAEMIQVDPDSMVVNNNTYYAFAYLPRKKIFDLLSSEYQNFALTFRKNAQAALADQFDLTSYTSALRQAQDAFVELASKALEIQAVTGRAIETFREYEKKYLDLASSRVDLLRKIGISVEIISESRWSTKEVLTMELTKALSQLGLNVSQAPCGPGRYLLKVRETIQCRRGSFGPQCAMNLTGELVGCDSRMVLSQIDITHPDFKGMHPRDEGKAVAELMDQVTADRLRPLVREALKPILPIL